MTTCANPRCGNQFPDRVQAGKSVKYCNRSCKNKHWEAVEYSPAKTKYRQSAKGQATSQRKAIKYKQSEHGQLMAELDRPIKLLEYRRKALTRKANRQTPCRMCRSIVHPFDNRRIVCSDVCEWLYGLITTEPSRCDECKAVGLWRQKFCSRSCQNSAYRRTDSYALHKRLSRISGKEKRRQRMKEQWVEDVDPLVMAERDSWICHICSEDIDPALKYPNYYSLSIDHVIPLAKGGSHGYDNCSSSHWICNVMKADRLDKGNA